MSPGPARQSTRLQRLERRFGGSLLRQLRDSWKAGSLAILALLLGLTLYTAAFVAEVVRSGLQAVPHGQTEAALSLGLSRAQILVKRAGFWNVAALVLALSVLTFVPPS